MDDLDRKILSLLAKNARMPVKEIAEQISLTSPAVSSRIHKLETDGIISGYTVPLHRPAAYRRQQPRPQPIGRPHRAEPPTGQRVPHPRRQKEQHTSAPLYFPVKTAILYLIL